MDPSLLEKVEILKNILVSRAQYKHQEGDVDEYVRLRAELISIPDIAERLPRFVRTCRSLSEFWDYIKENELPTYQSRRVFIRENFQDVIAHLESAASANSGRTEPSVTARVSTQVRPRPQGTATELELFLSHASEDKDSIARPLYDALREVGVTMWFDEAVLKIGDSLTAKIDEGLAKCSYGVVIISRSFLKKNWPQRELAGLVSREVADGITRILPIWHDVDHDTVIRYSPTLADRVAAKSSDGIPVLVRKILEVIRPQHPRGTHPQANTSLAPREPIAKSRRLEVQPLATIELSRTPTDVISAVGFSVRNALIKRHNIINNIHGQFTFTHFDVESFSVPALFAYTGSNTPEGRQFKNVISLSQGQQAELLMLAWQSKIPRMGTDQTRYYTISSWPLAIANEHHIYDVEWSVKLELSSSDSPKESFAAEYTLQVFPPPRNGLSFGARQHSCGQQEGRGHCPVARRDPG